MPGISHASFQQKNYMMVYHILASFFTQPAAGVSGVVAACPPGMPKRNGALRSTRLIG